MNVYLYSLSDYHYYYKKKQANQKLFLCTLQFRESAYNDWSIVFQESFTVNSTICTKKKISFAVCSSKIKLQIYIWKCNIKGFSHWVKQDYKQGLTGKYRKMLFVKVALVTYITSDINTVANRSAEFPFSQRDRNHTVWAVPEGIPLVVQNIFQLPLAGVSRLVSYTCQHETT